MSHSGGLGGDRPATGNPLCPPSKTFLEIDWNLHLHIQKDCHACGPSYTCTFSPLQVHEMCMLRCYRTKGFKSGLAGACFHKCTPGWPNQQWPLLIPGDE